MPYCPLALFEPSGSMRSTLPRIEPEVLRDVERVAAAAAVRRPDVEQTDVGIARSGERVEGDVSPVVVPERLLDAQQLARRPAVVDRAIRIGSGPFQQNRVLRVGTAVRHEVGRRPGVARIGIGVELPEAGRAGHAELRVHGEALEPALPAGRLDVEPPARLSEIEIARHRLPVVADGVDDAPHVVDEQAAPCPARRPAASSAAPGRRRRVERRTPRRRP